MGKEIFEYGVWKFPQLHKSSLLLFAALLLTLWVFTGNTGTFGSRKTKYFTSLIVRPKKRKKKEKKM